MARLSAKDETKKFETKFTTEFEIQFATKLAAKFEIQIATKFATKFKIKFTTKFKIKFKTKLAGSEFQKFVEATCGEVQVFNSSCRDRRVPARYR